MSGRSAQSNNRGSDLFGYFVSGKYKEFHTSQFAPSIKIKGLTATGGVISDYTSGPAVYRAHIFTSSGALNVTELGIYGDTVEYLVVAGGGGGGGVQPGGAYHGAGGGGGAGGLRTNLSGHPLAGSSFSVSVQPYPITVGGGGVGDPGRGASGSNSVFGPISSAGGGGGAGGVVPSETAGNGGSGGGASRENTTAGDGNTPPTSPPQGNNGGLSSPGGDGGGGGGGGYTGRGSTDDTNGGDGGIGVQVLISGPPTTTGVGAKNPSNSQYQYFAGGGGAGMGGNPANYAAGIGGAWNGSTLNASPLSGGGNGGDVPNNPGDNGIYSTGGGGGGAGAVPNTPGSLAYGGSGGSGIVVVRYQIAELTATAKATGGAISFYSGKTIHAFTSSGDFNVTNGPISADYLVIGGGGGGGFFDAGGGGAGSLKYATAQTISPGPYTVTVGAGGFTSPYPGPGAPGNGSNTIFNLPSAVTASGGGGGAPYKGGADTPIGGSGGGAGGGPPGPGVFGTTSASTGHPGGINVVSPPTGWGNPGATGTPNTNAAPTYGGGGGGAATAGDDGVTSPFPTARAGNGGDGARYSISGTTRYYAGGGGGGSQSNPGTPGFPLAPTGGQGGGGGGGYGGSGPTPAPADQSLGDNAEMNTGSGGGGGGQGDPPNNPTTSRGGAGGSGIVLIAYPS